MNYWLVKSEPAAWSWSQQVKAKVTAWTGVRNYQAANNLKAMKKGDLAFFYHSNDGKEIVGIVEIVREYFPDATDESGRFGAVDVKAVEQLRTPVTLAQIKAVKELQDIALIRQSRLSVMPVKAKEWKTILKMAGMA